MGSNNTEHHLKPLDDIIKNIVKAEKYITYNVTKRESSTGGYMGNISAFDIKGQSQHGEKEINIFVKQILQPQIKMIYDVPKIYEREKNVYSDIFKEFMALQEHANVPQAERFQTAKIFKGIDNENIILENLAVKGYKMYDKLDIVNLEYAELSIKALARMHGLSLAMQIKNPDYFKTKIKTLDCVYIFDEYFQGFQHNISKIAVYFLPEDLKNKLMHKLLGIVDKYKAYMNDESCKVKTICHGDYRPSNIMVKEIVRAFYETFTKNGKPSDVIAVDYQITFYGNPVLDLIYFIFWGTDQQFRRDHLNNLKELYYQHLKIFLHYFSISIEEVFPKQEFEQQYREKLDFGLMLSMFYLPFLFPKEDDVPNFEESAMPLNEMELKVDVKFGDRFRGIVDDFIEWGYL